jgi:signal transduction histidine kinase
MIIKASLRTIRREHLTAAEAREAAADIDEEVARLNRVVNDVLDFARPIRVELAPTNLNALCAECAAATTADGHRPGVRVIADASLTSVMTDPDRLRIVLINLLANARDAVDGQPRRTVDPLTKLRVDGEPCRTIDQLEAMVSSAEPAAAVPDIELRANRAANGQLVIVISDHGDGIPVEHLTRVFDPYFTTKRTGTGLGLAIAKNIIEGLGGTITVDSRPGEGTHMRIELPEQQASGFGLQTSGSRSDRS